jgi:hypothetical protein
MARNLSVVLPNCTLALVLLPAILSLSSDVNAAVSFPRRLTEEGQLFDKQTGLPVSARVSMVFNVYGASVGGNPLWTEVHEVVVDDGLFVVQLGALTPFPASLWDGSARFIGVAVGGDSEMTPREEITSVPYALVAYDVIGDIHPTSVQVGGRMVIDEAGRWVGDSAGLKGDKGEPGPKGEKGDKGDPGAGTSTASRVELVETPARSREIAASEHGYIEGDYCPAGHVVIAGDCWSDGDFNVGPVLLMSAKDEGVQGFGLRWACLFRNDTKYSKRISARTRCLKITNQ